MLDTPAWVAPAAALAGWLDAAAVVEAPGLEEEAAPWLDQVRAEAVVARRSLRLLAATRPALELDRDGRGRAAPVDPDAVLAMAARLLATWPPVRLGRASVLGPRCSARPSLAQRPDGGWRLRGDAIVEDGNALDRLVRRGLAAAASVGEPSLGVVVGATLVEVGPDGRFDVTEATSVRATSAGTTTGGTAPLLPPLPDRRLDSA